MRTAEHFHHYPYLSFHAGPDESERRATVSKVGWLGPPPEPDHHRHVSGKPHQYGEGVRHVERGTPVGYFGPVSPNATKFFEELEMLHSCGADVLVRTGPLDRFHTVAKAGKGLR
jgi:hypothetical protein